MPTSAVKEWYHTGTVNVTQSNATVIGVDTNWINAGISEGDLFSVDRSTWYEIKSVNSATSITLVQSYAGATVTGTGYSIIQRYQNVLNSELAARVSNLVNKYETYIDMDLQKIVGPAVNLSDAFKGTWQSGKAYKATDFVNYNNIGYFCISPHTANATNAPTGTAPLWVTLGSALQTDVFAFNGAGLHNSIFRGKNLGSSFTEAQSTMIKNGTFSDIWVGDYWTVSNLAYSYTNLEGTTVNATYSGALRVAALDYFLRAGDNDFSTHHIVVVPDASMFTHYMNSTNITTGGYVGSQFYTESDGLARAKAIFKAFFGATHVIKHRDLLTNAVTNGQPSAGGWFDSDVELMNEPMVYGGYIFAPANDGTNIPYLYTVGYKQLPMFALKPDLISNRQWYWLRDVVSPSDFALVHGPGHCNYNAAGDAFGVRPACSIS